MFSVHVGPCKNPADTLKLLVDDDGRGACFPELLQGGPDFLDASCSLDQGEERSGVHLDDLQPPEHTPAWARTRVSKVRFEMCELSLNGLGDLPLIP